MTRVLFPNNKTGLHPDEVTIAEMLKEKAKTIINAAKQHAEQHKANAQKELNSIQEDILKLQKQKQQLMDNIRSTAVEHLNKFKTGTHNGNAGNSVQD